VTAIQGKTTEITDMVLQSGNEICSLSDDMANNLNNINNNKVINMDSSESVDNNATTTIVDQFLQNEQSNVFILDEDNNNGNNRFSPDVSGGPETNIDTIISEDEIIENVVIAPSQHVAFSGINEVISGEKEKLQMEFKETDDTTDHSQMKEHNVIVESIKSEEVSSGDVLESKIFEELSIKSHGLVEGDNPFLTNDFSGENFDAFTTTTSLSNIDNRILDQQQQQLTNDDASLFMTESTEEIKSTKNDDGVQHNIENQVSSENRGELCIHRQTIFFFGNRFNNIFFIKNLIALLCL
jgi:hypothetical protein